MFNFSANHLLVKAKKDYSKCTVYYVQDVDTKRYYKIYDYTSSINMLTGSVYCISGKVNSADKLYLIAENCKLDTRYINKSIVKEQVQQMPQ